MSSRTICSWVFVLVMLWCLGSISVPAFGQEAAPVTADSDVGRWIFGFRAGVSRQTQDHVTNADTVVGGVGSLQLLYNVSKIIRVGLTVDGEYQQINRKGGSGKFGDLTTVAVMPTMEFRPFQATSVVPYFSVALGMNLNTFSTEAGVPDIKHDNTFAARIAGGLDFPLTSNVMLNTELGWRRNSGDSTQSGRVIPFDASAVMGLVGVRYIF